ncbi:FAD-dependent oxidoreductase [Kitasatospora sp. NPDC001574]
MSWCATCDGFLFRGKDIVVAGGDTTMEEVTFLTRFADSVTIVHRRSTLRASKARQDRTLTDDRISFGFDIEVAELRETDNGMPAGLVLRDTFTGEPREHPAAGLVVAVGHDPRAGLFKGRLEPDAVGCLRVHAPSTPSPVR